MHNSIGNPFAALVLGLGLLLASALTASAQNYVIRSGDLLQVDVLEDSSLNRRLLVLPDGSINFPMVGAIRAAGRTVEQVRRNLTTALTPNFASAPTVYVAIDALAEIEETSNLMDVYAIGEFEEAGRKEVKPGTTLLQFLAEAGGLSRFAADKRIELHRTDRRTGRVNTYRFNSRTPAGSATGISGGTRLAPGDVVEAPQRRLFE